MTHDDRAPRGSRSLAIVMFATAALVGAFAWWFGRMTPAGATRLFWLELSFTPGAFAESLRAWVVTAASAGHADPAAIRAFRWAIVGVDFLFIPTYVALLLSMYVWLEQTIGRQRLLTPVVACMLAAMLDVVENIGLLWLTRGLAGHQLSAASFAAPVVRIMSTASALKWAGLAVTAVFIARAFIGGHRGKILLLSRYSLLSIALGTVPLVATGQGQDLVAALAEKNGRVAHQFFFYVALGLWGLSVWYWTRVVLDAELATRGAPASYRGLPRHLPRVLGAATLLLPAVPIWFGAGDFRPRLLMIAGCVVLALILGLAVTRTRKRSSDGREPAVNGFSATAALERPAGKIAMLFTIVSIAVFAWLIAAPLTAGHLLGAVAILFVAAANTVFFGSLAVFASQATGVHIDLVAFACAAAFSFWNDNHDVRVVPRSDSRVALERRFAAWLHEMAPQQHQHQRPRIPVLLVSAEGGGIRAAYWTAKVLSALNDGQPTEFAPHVFAISGISGGSLGAAVYAGLRRDLTQPVSAMQAPARAILSVDFLAPVLAQLVTGDFAQWFIPLPVHAFDRSRAMEEGFARAYATEVRTSGTDSSRGDAFFRSFYELVPSAAQGVPALVLSATSVEYGRRVVTAPFTWDAHQLPDTMDYSEVAGFGAPTLAAAVHNSARFTYVSPAGLIRTADGAYRRHVVDGGYFDPSGADVLLDLMKALQALPGSGGLEFIPVFVTNGRISPDTNTGALAYSTATPASTMTSSSSGAPTSDQPGGAAPAEPAPVAMYTGELQAVKILGELFAPVRAVLAARDAHGRVAIARQQQTPGAVAFGFCEMKQLDGKWIETSPGDRSPGTKPPVEPPLGWQLSARMVDQLDAYWNACRVNRDGRNAIRRLLGSQGTQ